MIRSNYGSPRKVYAGLTVDEHVAVARALSVAQDAMFKVMGAYPGSSRTRKLAERMGESTQLIDQLRAALEVELRREVPSERDPRAMLNRIYVGTTTIHEESPFGDGEGNIEPWNYERDAFAKWEARGVATQRGAARVR